MPEMQMRPVHPDQPPGLFIALRERLAEQA